MFLLTLLGVAGSAVLAVLIALREEREIVNELNRRLGETWTEV